MSSPAAIPASTPYIPVHRRNQGTPSSYPASETSRTPSPGPHHTRIYSPAELLSLADAPLTALFVDHVVDALRESAPEVVQTRKQRKAMAWHARYGYDNQHRSTTPRHGRTASRGSHTSESEEERAISWRRV